MNQQEQSLERTQPPPVPPAWRREAEIDTARQEFLRQRLAMVADVQQGIYPFKDIRLTRADVEWLLVNHEQGRGPVDWSDVNQRQRQGLDLRGADLRRADLRGLPLAGLRGGLTQPEWVATTNEQREQAIIHLEHANLSEAHLEGALLRGACLQHASLRFTNLEQAILFQARLEESYLRGAHLEKANLMYAHMEGAYLRKARLPGADLRYVHFDSATLLEKVTLHDTYWGCALLADIHWNDCNLSLINWRRMPRLGDEALARTFSIRADSKKTIKEKQRNLDRYQGAARANRQLAHAMRSQGMNDEAMPFAYRALVLQRVVLLRYLAWGTSIFSEEQAGHTGIRRLLLDIWGRLHAGASYLFSWFLDLLAGYGYKPERSLAIYLVTIFAFAIVYHATGGLSDHEALIFSITSFHGRGFLPGTYSLANPETAVSAYEGIIGLFIEVSFVATFTQRFFGR
ncbi:pentapeptide repeat-containing protein [Dictyobacter aurantiacus]|uniref:pentapeptide repeat-containing protein n=1 Tax=Dictyobacter aurantiacus TaxID=1936993 RepID=UPI000F83B5D3|nr:pentapeptide repeat-containing protein [Dictyobacter aurantiacus]